MDTQHGWEHACLVLQWQADLIDWQQAELVRLRAERDALLALHTKLDRVLQNLLREPVPRTDVASRACRRCQQDFQPTGPYTVVCRACRSDQNRLAGAASQRRRLEAAVRAKVR